MDRKRMSLGALLSASLLLSACGEDGGVSTTPPDDTDAGCLRTEQPVSYEVYFVVDVSGSMAPFLTDVRNELVTFADGFPEENDNGRRVRVDYYLIAFVNDVKMYGGGRMSSVIAVQDAFDQAIEDGQTNYNLNTRTFNAEEEENLLDALSMVLDLEPSAQGRIAMVATDANFVEKPSILTDQIPVQSTYSDIRARLAAADVRIHAFTEAGQPGFFVPYGAQEPLTSLPGSQVYDLEQVTTGVADLRETLFGIARDAACN